MCGSNDVYILEFFQYVSQHSHLTKHQIPACLARNYILTSKGRHHFSVFSKENSDISICFRLISASIIGNQNISLEKNQRLKMEKMRGHVGNLT
jgi:hypothetical protein